MTRGISSRKGRAAALRNLAAGSLFALALAGCQSTGTHGSGASNIGGALAPSDLSQDQAVGAVQKWGAAYSRNEKDKLAAINYAAALRAAGETSQAVSVMRKSAIYHPTDRDVLAGFGKALAADGQFPEALQTIRRAQRRDNPDWQLLSAEGGILDSIGEHDQARALYRQALVLAPGEPQVLNNLGMSYVLTGELDKAEETLKQAAAHPSATLRVRQNLELVQGLRSKGGGSGKVAARATAPEAAATDLPSPAGRSAPAEQDIWKDIEQAG